MSDLSISGKWQDGAANTPPEAWSADKELFVFQSGLASVQLSYLNDPAPTLTFYWKIVTASDAGPLVVEYNSATGQKSIELGTAVGQGAFVIEDADPTDFWWRVTDSTGDVAPTGTGVVEIGDPDVIFNCSVAYGDDVEIETLATLRRRWLVRMGYAAQADNPPPGMAELANEFLADAQRILFKRFPVLDTERWFSWTMVPGVRFYGVRSNYDAGAAKLDPYNISWVGLEDLNGQWYELRKGIPPEFYTDITNYTWPTCYEIRQCIEVFPPPADAYKLRVKGRIGLLPFAQDTDSTTIPSNPVFHWALGMGKRHYNKPDANDYFDIALKEIGDFIAGTHGTARYVPKPGRDVPPPPKPIMKGGFE